MSQSAEEVGNSIAGTVWEMHAPDAPFPWHVVRFAADGTVMQTNPHEGNKDESDSSGLGLWKVVQHKDGPLIVAKFVEYKANRETGRYTGKGVIKLVFRVDGNTFTGDSNAYKYNTKGELDAGPLYSPVNATRVTLGDNEFTDFTLLT